MNIFTLRYKELVKYIILIVLFVIFFYYFILQNNEPTISIPAQIRFGGIAENGKVQVIAEFNADELKDLWLKRKNIELPQNKLLPAKSDGIPLAPNKICTKEISWIVYIISEVKNFDRRDSVRKTWADYKLYKEPFFRVVFLVGITKDTETKDKLLSEHLVNNDILETSTLENERTETSKTTFALRWIATNCAHHTYVLKANDNSFINMFELVPLVSQLSSQLKDKHRFIACPIWGADLMPIQRDASVCGKYCVGEQEFHGQTHYPQYCAGTGVVMTKKIVEELDLIVSTTPSFFIEDVYLTGLLAPKLKPPVHYIDLIDYLKLDVSIVKTHYAARDSDIKIMLTQLHADDMPIIFNHALARIKPQIFKLLTNEAINSIS